MDSRDIAKLAGVSRSTVSRVINNHPNVSAETRQKILKIIEEQGYVPDSSARALVGKQNKVIGLFIINANSKNKTGIFSSNYYSPFTAAVIDEANQLKYHVLVSLLNSNDDYDEAKKLFKNKSICGAIFVGAEDNSSELRSFIDAGYNIAVVDQSVPNNLKAKNAVFINSDNKMGGYLATMYLLATGHKKIAHITGNLNKLSGSERYQGYCNALQEFNNDFNELLVKKGDFSEKSGYESTLALIKDQKPDAIFLANDTMALGALKAIKDLKLRVPDDISIIGYDNIDIASYMGLSTIRASIHDMASVTVNQLIKIVENNEVESLNNIVKCELITRQTSK